MKKLINFLFIIWVLSMCGLVFTAHQLDNLNRQLLAVNQELTTISQRLDKPAEIVYQVDSYGGNLHGKVKAKEVKENGYAVEIGNYGWFLVTEEQFYELEIGDDAPEFLKKRGS